MRSRCRPRSTRPGCDVMPLSERAVMRRVEPVWGTMIGVCMHDRIDAGVLDDVFLWFHRVDDLFSTWRPDTEISRIARGELDIAGAAAEVREVLSACEGQ